MYLKLKLKKKSYLQGLAESVGSGKQKWEGPLNKLVELQGDSQGRQLLLSAYSASGLQDMPSRSELLFQLTDERRIVSGTKLEKPGTWVCNSKTR